MKTLGISWAWVFVALLPTLLPAAGRDVKGDSFVRIDRSSTLESGGLDRDSQQRIAQLTGYGEFFVRTAKIRDDDLPLGQARVFYVFSSKDALRSNEPIKRIFCSAASTEGRINPGDDEELANYFIELISIKSLDNKTVCKVLPEILSAAVYENRADLLSFDFQKLSDAELGKVLACDPVKRAELRALCRDPQVSHDSGDRLEWEGRFLLCDGGVEVVTLTLSKNRDRLVRLKRLAVRPRNYFRNNTDVMVDAEEWAVRNESNWRPAKRDSFNFTLATLGNTKAKYQLGLALMEEYDENAKAEGIKWLRAAAADGYGDAVTRVAQIDADSRSLRDREGVRKDSCCRLPRK